MKVYDIDDDQKPMYRFEDDGGRSMTVHRFVDGPPFASPGTDGDFDLASALNDYGARSFARFEDQGSDVRACADLSFELVRASLIGNGYAEVDGSERRPDGRVLSFGFREGDRVMIARSAWDPLGEVPQGARGTVAGVRSDPPMLCVHWDGGLVTRVFPGVDDVRLVERGDSPVYEDGPRKGRWSQRQTRRISFELYPPDAALLAHVYDRSAKEGLHAFFRRLLLEDMERCGKRREKKKDPSEEGPKKII